MGPEVLPGVPRLRVLAATWFLTILPSDSIDKGSQELGPLSTVAGYDLDSYVCLSNFWLHGVSAFSTCSFLV